MRAWQRQQRWDLKGTSKLWLSWVSLPNNVTCWDSSTAPLSKLQVALGNKRSLLWCAWLPMRQMCRQSIKPSRLSTMETTPVYYLFSKLMYFITTRCGNEGGRSPGAGWGGGSNMINNWYAVWESWFATSPLVHLSLAVVRTHWLWWEIWRRAQQHHIWLER